MLFLRTSINDPDQESCDCTADYPKTETGGTLKIAFAYIVLFYAVVLVGEAFFLKKHYRIQRQSNTIFIYTAISLAGYCSMVISQLLSATKLSCWLIVIFRLIHYAVFYLVGVIYILNLMMGRVKHTFVRAGHEKLYDALKYMLYIAGFTGLISLIFMARRLCGTSGRIGFYVGAVASILTEVLLISFLLIKYVIIRLHDHERYDRHKCYYMMLIIYLTVIVILGIVYSAIYYRYKENTDGGFIFYIIHSLTVMTFPLLIILYFAQQSAGAEEGNNTHHYYNNHYNNLF